MKTVITHLSRSRVLRSSALVWLAFAAAAGVLASGGIARAADGTWNTQAGNWSTAGSWVGSVIPGSTTATNSTDTAYFSALLTAARTVTVDTNRNIRSITFDDGNSGTFGYSISSGSLLLTSGGTIASTGGVGAHTDTISSPMTILGNNATYRFNNDSTLATRLLRFGSVTGQSIAGGTTTLYLGGNNSGGNQLDGVLSPGTGGGKLAIVKDGSSYWQIRGVNGQYIARTDSTAVTVNSGTLQFGVLTNFGTRSLTLANAANTSVEFGNDTTWYSNFGSISGGGSLGGLINTSGLAQGINNGFDNTSTTFGGWIVSGTGGYGVQFFRQLGTGTLTLTGSGNQINPVINGNLRLDFSQATTGTDIIENTRSLRLAGGRLLVTGSVGGTNSQSFTSLTADAGANFVVLNSNTAASLVVTLNSSIAAPTRAVGGTLDITLPDGTPSATNGVRMSVANQSIATNGVLTQINGPAYATVGGTTWAVVPATALTTFNVTPLATASYATGTANYTATSNVDVTNGDTVATGTVNTLRFNGSNTLNLTGITTITTGGVLATPLATTGTITGGTIRPGTEASRRELVFHNYGGQFTIGSEIANTSGGNATALTLSGTGGYLVSGINTYTGTTFINNSTVKAGSTQAFGVNSVVNIGGEVGNGGSVSAVLDLNGYDLSLGSLSGGGGVLATGGGGLRAQRDAGFTPGGLLAMGTNSVTVGGANTTTLYGGRISGSGLMSQMFGYRTDPPSAWTDPARYFSENYAVHEAVFEAVSRGDALGARGAMLAHMKLARRTMLARFDHIQLQANATEALAHEFPDSVRARVREIELGVGRADSAHDSD